jgi:hypothetical protein
MYLVQLLLPLYDNKANHFSENVFASINGKLTGRFGGVTAHTRAPAEGLWLHHSGVTREDVVEIEVMVDVIDRVWWRNFRQMLEAELNQEEIIIRAHLIQRL